MRLLISALFLSITLACQPGIRDQRRAMNVTPAIDSSLYYPTKTIQNNFLTSLINEKDIPVSLSLTLLPPPPPPSPKFDWVDGFRIQLFAGGDSLNTRVLFNKTKRLIPDSVYFFREAGLYKIQIGDFLIRNKADLRLLKLRQKNLKGMWVVARKIKKPIYASPARTEAETKNSTAPFSIQILATSDTARVSGLTESLAKELHMPAFFSRKDSLYKIYIGHFTNHAQADSSLQIIRKKGYPNAWIFKFVP